MKIYEILMTDTILSSGEQSIHIIFLQHALNFLLLYMVHICTVFLGSALSLPILSNNCGIK